MRRGDRDRSVVAVLGEVVGIGGAMAEELVGQVDVEPGAHVGPQLFVLLGRPQARRSGRASMPLLRPDTRRNITVVQTMYDRPSRAQSQVPAEMGSAGGGQHPAWHHRVQKVVPAGPDTAPVPRDERSCAAATQIFLQLGVAKTTMHDVRALRDLSRGTVYRYFPDRRSSSTATVTQTRSATTTRRPAECREQTTLAHQVGAFGGGVRPHIHRQHRSRAIVPDDLDLFRIMASDIDGALRRMSNFLHPFVRAGKRGRGEIAGR